MIVLGGGREHESGVQMNITTGLALQYTAGQNLTFWIKVCYRELSEACLSNCNIYNLESQSSVCIHFRRGACEAATVKGVSNVFSNQFGIAEFQRLGLHLVSCKELFYVFLLSSSSPDYYIIQTDFEKSEPILESSD